MCAILIRAPVRGRGQSLSGFDVPGDVNGTYPSTITADGVIFGSHIDANFITHGFLRARSGAFTEIDGPEGATGQLDMNNPGPALSINPQGVITGTYFEPIAGNPAGGNFRVFGRSKDGKYITLEAANYPPCCIWSAPFRINPARTITGSFNDGFNINHSFGLSRDGTLTTFDPSGGGHGLQPGYTSPSHHCRGSNHGAISRRTVYESRLSFPPLKAKNDCRNSSGV